MAGRHLGTVVGALIGGALGYLGANAYDIPLMYTLGPFYKPLAIATGAIIGGLTGKYLYNKKT